VKPQTLQRPKQPAVPIRPDPWVPLLARPDPAKAD
jgi:hypothetical protein